MAGAVKAGFYDGPNAPKRGAAAEVAFSYLETLEAVRKVAQAIADGVAPEAPFSPHADFVSRLSDIARLFPIDRERTTPPGGGAHSILISAEATTKVEYMIDGPRDHLPLSPGGSEVSPFGTTSNEQIRSELNAQICTTAHLRQITFSLKMRASLYVGV